VFGTSADGLSVQLEDFLLPGPDSAAGYNFSIYTLSDAFASTAFSEIDFVGFVCNAAGNCTAGVNSAQFGLDNLTLADPLSVPEPASIALVVMALTGAGLTRRRRSV
jgi:hypothetical protein